MSYNGIGLQTPRGSGTNGYVQRNLSNVYQGRKGQSEGKHFLKREQIRKQREREEKHERSKTELYDEGLINHERKRQLEVEVMEYREKLEEDDELKDDDVEKLVAEYRETLKNGRLANSKRRGGEERYHKEERSRSRSPERQAAYNLKVDPFAKAEREQKEGNSETPGN